MSSYLGQNFLTDEDAKTQIIDTITQMKSEFDLDQVVEIGPGQGALTHGLMTQFDRITLIEMDTKMKSYLEALSSNRGDEGTRELPQNNGNIGTKTKELANSQTRKLEIIWGDILKQQGFLQSISNKTHTLIYGSLPYYITSPIFRLVMIECGLYYGLFIIQKEVGDKIATTARKKSYLWWLLNAYFEVTITQLIPGSSFTPPPKVTSCVVKLTRLSQPKLSKQEYEKMLVLLDQISGYKRKTLGKIWKMIGRDDLPTDLLGKRLEELGWEEMKNLI